MIDQVSCFIIFFAGFMSWTIAIGIMLENEKQTYHHMFAGLMFCLGVLQILDGLLVLEKVSNYWISGFYPLAFWHLPFLAWVGPLFFLTFKSANNDSFFLRPLDYLHFSGGMIIVPLIIPLVMMDAETKTFIIRTGLDLSGENIMFRYYSILLLAVICVIVCYMVYFIKESFFMLKIKVIKEKMVSPYIVTIILLVFPLQIIFFISMIAIIFMEDSQAYYYKIIQALTALSFFLTLGVFIMEKKNVNFFKMLHHQIEERRHEKSKMKNIDLAHVLSKITTLMEEQKIFFDEELSVNDMALELAIEPYQLSRIINENFNKNFNSFVNEYRIEEAKRMLLEDGDRTVISVAYAVGFNSTTVFYDWFNRLTGNSPKRFRSVNKK